MRFTADIKTNKVLSYILSVTLVAMAAILPVLIWLEPYEINSIKQVDMKDFHGKKEVVTEFIRLNINSISPKKTSLGQPFKISSLSFFLHEDKVVVNYEDNVNSYEAIIEFRASKDDVEIISFKIIKKFEF